MTAITITWDDVVALAPELSAISAAGQTQVLAQVALQVSVTKWGSLERANAAAVWLARHVASVSGKGGAGALTGVTVGKISQQFAQPLSLLALNTTRYGMEYMRLARLWLGTSTVAGGLGPIVPAWPNS